MQAVKGLAELVSDYEEINPGGKEKTFELKAPDRESLLVDFLNEILYKINSENWFPSGGNCVIENSSLKASLRGEVKSSSSVKNEVKAATYHKLKLEKDEEGFRTEIYFDL